MNKLPRELWTGAGLGALVGLVVAVATELTLHWDSLSFGWKLPILVITAGLVGGFGPLLYQQLRAKGVVPELELIPVPIPGLGSVKLKLGDDTHRRIAWTLFVEVTSRAVTQKLDPRSGHLREAMDSLYQTFNLVREQLAGSLPSPVAPARMPGERDSGERSVDMTVEGYALALLNESLRPFLSRWHPRLKAWEATGKAEQEWPLDKLCRQDLEAARQRALIYAWGLGRASGVGDLEHLLEKPETPPDWVDDETLASAEDDMGPGAA